MLQEYALEPTLLNNWKDVRFFLSQFGFDQGRLILRYPSKWKQMVYESLGSCGDIEKSRIIECLRRVDSKLVKNGEWEWTNALGWLDNALRGNEINPIHAIIAKDPPEPPGNVLAADLIHDASGVDTANLTPAQLLWRARKNKIFRREAAEFSEITRRFVTYANTIRFIDPHFGPENSRHRIPFKEILANLEHRNPGQPPPIVEFHLREKSTRSFFETKCNSDIAPLIRNGQMVSFFRWTSRKLHNRFLLTEIGGLAFLTGLDIFQGDGPEEDVVVLLDDETSQHLFRDYSSQNSTLGTCETPFSIVGMR